MEWSPRGSFLATVHRQGVQLWGGPSFVRLGRVAHGGEQRMLFSPDERYLLTFSEFPDPRGRPMVCGRAGRAPIGFLPWATAALGASSRADSSPRAIRQGSCLPACLPVPPPLRPPKAPPPPTRSFSPRSARCGQGRSCACLTACRRSMQWAQRW